MYCELPGQRYPFNEEDLQALVKKYCGLAKKLEEVVKESKSVVSKVKEQINDVIKKREKITEAVNKYITTKIAETKHLKVIIML